MFLYEVFLRFDYRIVWKGKNIKKIVVINVKWILIENNVLFWVSFYRMVWKGKNIKK